MRTRAENLWILRNASGQTAQENPVQQNNIIRSRDESLRILQTFPVILNREAVKNPVNRSAENYSPMSPNDVGATLAVARPNGSPTGGAGVSPHTETKPMGSGGGGFSGGGGGRSGRAADNSGFSGRSGNFANPESQTVQSSAAGQTRQEPSQPEKALTAADYDRLIREKEAELARWEEWDYDATSTRERQKYDNGIKAYENEIESLKTAKWKAEKEEQYGPLKNNADYETHSSATEEKPTAGFGIGWGTSWWGKGDPVYDYINDIDGTREKWNNPSTMGHSPYSIYDYMDEDEIKTYNYLYNTEGKEAAGKYLDYIEYALNDRSTKWIAQSAAEMADKHPVVSSAASIPTNLVSGIGLADVAWQNLKRELNGEYVPIDYSRGAMAPSVMTSAIRGTVAQNIADSTGVIALDEEEHPYLSKIFNGKSLGDVYQLGMSMADSLTVAYLTPLGKYGAVLLGGSAGTQGMLDALERGATDNQALKMGLLNGTFEALFEYVSLDKLLTSEPKNLIRALLKQGGVEASEEFMTTFANNIADILVMAEKSDYQLKIQAYMESGMSREKATKQALLDKCIELGWDAVGGFFSGGISGGISTNVSGINSSRGTQTQGQTQAQAQGMTAALQNQAPQPGTEQKNSAPEEAESTRAVSNDIVRKLKDSIPDIQQEPIVSALSGNEFAKGERKLTEQVGDFLKSLGNRVFRKGFGSVIIDERSVKNDIAHGLGRAKAVTFAAVPDVIASGKQIDFQENWKGRGYNSYVFAAPVKIGDQTNYVAAVVLSDSNNRFYLHEVVDENGNLIYKMKTAPADIKTGVTAKSGITGAGEAVTEATASNNSIAQNGENSNGNPQPSTETGNTGERSGKGAPSGGTGTQSVTEGGTTAAETTANTDSAAAARQQQYQTEITAALRDGDYQQTMKLFKEYGNPNLRALNEIQTLKAFGDYAAAMGYDVSPEDLSTDETLAAFEESFQNAIENAVEGSIITSGADVVKDAIKAGSVSTTINSEKQARHIFGSDGYIAGRSYINGTLEDAQMLVDALSGTGTPIFDKNGNWTNKERVQCKNVIGIHVDQDTKNENETKKATIIYSKTGSHIVPRKGDDK